jgi:CheY-like chemotaxis protein
MRNGEQTNGEHRRERILFVDDEAAVAHIGQAILTHLGYEAVIATSSQEGLATFHAAPHHFALLITDYTMPALTGAELAAACRQLRPDIPIILCTGYSPALNADQAAAQGINVFLPKPFGVEDLACAIRQALGHGHDPCGVDTASLSSIEQISLACGDVSTSGFPPDVSDRGMQGGGAKTTSA